MNEWKRSQPEDSPFLQTYPWYRETYWAMLRFLKDTFVDFDWYYAIKNFIHRGRKGWSDRDLWSLDMYLAGWLPEALRRLSERSHGIPGVAYGPDGSELYALRGDDAGDTEFSAAVELWKETLENMARGFEAMMILDEHGFRHDSEAEQKLVKIRDDGMNLFVNNLSGLWD